MKHNPFKITESEKNRIKSLHEVVKYKPQIDSTLNYATTHVITEDDGGSTTSPQCGSRLTCCNASGQPYCPTGNPKSCPNNNHGYTYDPKTKSCTKGRGQKWHCEGGNCSKHPSGQYNSKASCEKACRSGNTRGENCCCKNRETGQVQETSLRGDTPCTCKPGWIQIKCESNTSGSGCCCNCKDGTNTPMQGGGCNEQSHIKPWTGPDCHSKGCEQACKGFAPTLYTESTYELPIRYGKRRMSESQLVKMIRRISEEQELQEKGKACWKTSQCPVGQFCSGGGCVPIDKDDDDDDERSQGYDDSRGKWGDRGKKLNERKLSNIIRKVMFESQMLNEIQNCIAGAQPGGDDGAACACGCETGSCELTGTCGGGVCDCPEAGMYSGGGGAQLADAPGKTKGRGRDRAMDGAKLNERKLTNIIRKVMFESQLLTEIENCSDQADGTECDGGCDDTPPSCFQGTCQDGVCTPNSSSTGGGGYYEDDYALSYDDDDYYDYDDELPIRYSRGRMNESQLLTEKVVCDSHADCPGGSKCYYWNDGSGRQECCAGWDRKTGCNEVNPESTTNVPAGFSSVGGVMGGAKLNERKLTNIIRKVMSESQLLLEVVTCTSYADCGPGQGCYVTHAGCGTGNCCDHGGPSSCAGCGNAPGMVSGGPGKTKVHTRPGKTFDGGEYEEYDDYHTARGGGGNCAGRTCSGDAGTDCGEGCVCDGKGLCNKGDGRTIRQQTSRRY